jgi:hypothetical protein
MVHFELTDRELIVQVNGLHKLWSLKSELRIDRTHIVGVHTDLAKVESFGLRFPGTCIPGLIKAGTYIHATGKDFWDVVNRSKSIVIELKDEEYQHLVVEVEDVSDSLKQLSPLVS